MDIRDLTQHELREQIGYMPQKASLFKGTIASNLKYADENASDDDIRKVADIAQAMEFISEKPEGFNTEISQGVLMYLEDKNRDYLLHVLLLRKPKFIYLMIVFQLLILKQMHLLERH